MHKIWDIDVPSERAACNAYGVDAVESATQNFDELLTLGGSLLLRTMEKAFRCAADGPVGREPFIVWFTEDEHEYTNEEILTLTASWNKYVPYSVRPVGVGCMRDPRQASLRQELAGAQEDCCIFPGFGQNYATA